ncbi:UNVERIFIED_CONTAM: Anaphase-promoting complex subunit [Sesamum radiatum]|uniref:Anaphase-promoting complex subunit n=1 Tax=Sesamum radiatum TaxID=300843 RepID=A0AAW2TEE9_SESRA
MGLMKFLPLNREIFSGLSLHNVDASDFHQEHAFHFAPKFLLAQIALAYNEALSNGRLTTSRGEIVQSVFLGSLKKRVEDLLNSLNLTADFRAYTMSGKWPTDGSNGKKSQTILSWYLQWHSVPSPLDIKRAVEKINCTKTQPSIPLLRLVFPRTHVAAINVINSFLVSSKVED